MTRSRNASTRPAAGRSHADSAALSATLSHVRTSSGSTLPAANVAGTRGSGGGAEGICPTSARLPGPRCPLRMWEEQGGQEGVRRGFVPHPHVLRVHAARCECGRNEGV
eukprot:351644-Prorocentrum_minimum.AAC.1